MHVGNSITIRESALFKNPGICMADIRRVLLPNTIHILNYHYIDQESNDRLHQTAIISDNC